MEKITLEEVINQAIEREEDSFAFYQHLKDRVLDKISKEQFEELYATSVSILKQDKRNTKAWPKYAKANEAMENGEYGIEVKSTMPLF